MPFDPSSAEPVAGGFDPSSAKPADGGKFNSDNYAGMSHPLSQTEEALPFVDRVGLTAMDNDAERHAYLDKRYGKENVVEQGGKLFVKKDGHLVDASAAIGFVERTLGSSPELASATATAATGAAEGSAAGPYGALVGGVGGAVIGAVAGKSAKEGIKAASGVYQKTPGELGDKLGETGKQAMEGQLAGNLVGGAVAKAVAGDWSRWLFDVTPESSATTARVLARGAIPPPGQTLPSARAIQRIEIMSAKLGAKGQGQDIANEQYLKTRTREILVKSGMTDQEAAQLEQDMSSPMSAHSTEDVGKLIQDSTKAKVDTITASVTKETAGVEKELDASLSRLKTITHATKPGDLGVDVSAGIQTARKDFMTAIGKVYGRIDQAIGQKPVIPVEDVIREGQRLTKLAKGVQPTKQAQQAGGMPGKKEVDPDTKALFDSLGIELPPAGGMMTFGQAQRMRSILQQASQPGGGINRTVTQGELASLSKSVDRAINSAAKDPAVEPYIDLLHHADVTYRMGIRKFEEAGIEKLVRDVRSGVSPDPEEVASLVLKPGRLERAAELKKMLGPEVWQRVAGADFNRMISNATTRDEMGREFVRGMNLHRELDNRGADLLKTAYGPAAKDIRELADYLASRDGVVPVDALKSGNVKTALEGLRASEAAKENLMSKDFVRAFTSGQVGPEESVRWLMKPGNMDRARQLEATFGANSKEVAALRQGALRELATMMTKKSIDKKGSNALGDALGGFTKDQQEFFFPNGLVHDIKDVSKELEMVFPSGSKDPAMAGMTAGAILNKPFYKRWYYQAVAGAERWLIQRPSVIRYLAIGLKHDAQTRAAVQQTIKGLVMNYDLMNTEYGDDFWQEHAK
jgi:hypothetical protein